MCPFHDVIILVKQYNHKKVDVEYKTLLAETNHFKFQTIKLYRKEEILSILKILVFNFLELQRNLVINFEFRSLIHMRVCIISYFYVL